MSLKNLLLPLTRNAWLYKDGKTICTSSRLQVSLVYSVTLKTGRKFGAGTDANVFIRMVGELGSTDKIVLKTKPGDLERGRTNSYRVKADYVGPLKKIIVGHDNTGFAPGWFLERVSVRDGRGQQFNFECNDWLAKTSDNDVIKLLKEDGVNGSKSHKVISKEYSKVNVEPSRSPLRQYCDSNTQLENKVVTADASLEDVMKSILKNVEIDDDKRDKDEDSKDYGLHEDSHDIEKTNEYSTSSSSFMTSVSNRHAKLLSPAVRYLLNTYDVRHSEVKGTGPHSLLLKGDIIHYMKIKNITKKKKIIAEDFLEQDSVTPGKSLAPVVASTSTKIFHTIQQQPTVITSPGNQNKYEIPHVYMSNTCSLEKFQMLMEKLNLINDTLELCKAAALVRIFSFSLNRILVHMQSSDIDVNMDNESVYLSNCENCNFEEIFDKFNQKTSGIDSKSELVLNLNLSSDGVMHQSTVLKNGQTLALNYSGETLGINEFGKVTRNCYVSVTYDGRNHDEEKIAKLLKEIKFYIENPEKIGL